MSYHEIEVKHRFIVQCVSKEKGQPCLFEVSKNTAGEAELAAREHIDGCWDGEREIEGKYDHVVEINEVVLVGRQLEYHT